MTLCDPPGGGGGGGGGALAGKPYTDACSKDRKTYPLNGVFYILKLIPLFTLSSQKVPLSNVVN